MQNRVSDPTMSNPGGLWVSPLRDVAHFFPHLVKGALTSMEKDLDESNNEMMCGYAVALSKFVSNCTGPDAPNDIVELYKVSGLLEFPDEAHLLFGKWLSRAMLGMYFTSIKEAMHPGETAIGVADLVGMVDLLRASDDKEE